MVNTHGFNFQAFFVDKGGFIILGPASGNICWLIAKDTATDGARKKMQIAFVTAFKIVVTISKL